MTPQPPTLPPVQVQPDQPVTVLFSDSEILTVIPLNHDLLGDNIYGPRRALKVLRQEEP